MLTRLPNRWRGLRHVAPGIAALALLAGCATGNNATIRPGAIEGAIELEATPFFPQERYQCGPAALTTILVDSGADASLDEVRDIVYLPGRKGSLQAELIAASRAHGRIPYEVDGSLDSLVAELVAGRPVLVLQNLGVQWFPQWHYAVVIGIDPVRQEVILRSGTDARRIMSTRTFLRTWRRGDSWGLVALPPGDLPAGVDKARYFKAVAAMETVGQAEAALAGWKAAVRQWPEDKSALFGQASAAYGSGEFPMAEQLYRELLRHYPDLHAARNNLAYALAKQGRKEEALDELRFLLDRLAADDDARASYAASYAELAGLSTP